ncbi:MAG: Release factor glutamine methyltransferase [Luteibacter sp.]|uniref:peptide chain release factor N(5)-glutamine methyltransferase n=1 Tax=Luteibacter sp. TaxID=1886636 RepID=UPI00137DC4D6|nr:peptide chain release factor N(5)-glutamine methyltransferase [Luteibacter sp.]KAF1003480.1 MAG: Release factor glutamine methyltransferase [Luteibacter sp.]
MTNVRTILRNSAEMLGERLEAELLLAHVLGVNRAWFFAHADDEIGGQDNERFDALVARRADGEPVAYITGRRDFWSLSLEVSPATLIPRPETELLVELALAHLPTGGRVLDLGTGSGAIALAIAKERPDAEVVAVDVSAGALEVAVRNARTLGLERVDFRLGDWLAPVIGERYAVIASNPPYIESTDEHLSQGDLRFEPMSALASGIDGLDDIRRLATLAGTHVVEGGWLLMEHGWRQGDSVRTILAEAGWIDVHTWQDLEGRDRVTGGRAA